MFENMGGSRTPGYGGDVLAAMMESIKPMLSIAGEAVTTRSREDDPEICLLDVASGTAIIY